MHHQILAIHGNSSSADTFQQLIALNPDQSFTTVHLPGHGQQSRADDPAKEYTIASILDHIAHELSKIEGKVILYGNSLGGHLAMELLASFSDKIQALIISGAPPVGAPPIMEDYFNLDERMMHLFKEELSEKEAAAVFEHFCHQTKHLQEQVNTALHTDPRVRAILAEELSKGAWSDQKYIVESSTVPIFYIGGQQDPVVIEDYIRSINNIKAVFMIPEAGHYPHFEQPEKVTEVLNEIFTFLEQ